MAMQNFSERNEPKFECRCPVYLWRIISANQSWPALWASKLFRRSIWHSKKCTHWAQLHMLSVYHPATRESQKKRWNNKIFDQNISIKWSNKGWRTKPTVSFSVHLQKSNFQKRGTRPTCSRFSVGRCGRHWTFQTTFHNRTFSSFLDSSYWADIIQRFFNSHTGLNGLDFLVAAFQLCGEVTFAW